jgi:hypothetical protein
MLPMARVNREKFIQRLSTRELKGMNVQVALKKSPNSAYSQQAINKAAKKIIAKHALWVTLISAISAIPTGWMMIPFFIIDIIQFQIHVFAVSQKLLYLYEDEEKLTEYSSDTATQLMILMTTIMIGKQQFTRMLKSATGVVTKQVIQRFTIKALTQFSILNIVRQVAKWFGIVLTKETLLEGIDVAIIIICAIISGLISLWLFKPMANNLMKYLKEENRENF